MDTCEWYERTREERGCCVCAREESECGVCDKMGELALQGQGTRTRVSGERLTQSAK